MFCWEDHNEMNNIKYIFFENFSCHCVIYNLEMFKYIGITYKFEFLTWYY